jgi:hypothetical protein
MANELKHASAGNELTQAEWEGTAIHVFDNQATGDILYASSAAQLSRLPIGSGILISSGGVPAWSTSLPSQIKLSGALDANGQEIISCYGFSGKSNDHLYIYTIAADKALLLSSCRTAANAGNGLIFRSYNASNADTNRLAITSGANVAVLNITSCKSVYDADSLPNGDPHIAGQIYYTSADGIVRRSAG